LYLHSSYNTSVDDEEPGVEYRMATKFIKNIHILDEESRSNVLVHMHTTGGNWTDGMAMFDTVIFSKSAFTILAYSMASSMSGIFLQCADRRVLMPNCEFMIHHGSIFLNANSLAVKSAVEMNEHYCKLMLQIFAKKAIMGPYFKNKNYDHEKVVDFIDKKIKEYSDWYMTAEEAVNYGFADGILGQKGFESISKIRVGRKYKEQIC